MVKKFSMAMYKWKTTANQTRKLQNSGTHVLTLSGKIRKQAIRARRLHPRSNPGVTPTTTEQFQITKANMASASASAENTMMDLESGPPTNNQQQNPNINFGKPINNQSQAANINAKILAKDKDRVAGRVCKEDIEKGFADLQLNIRKLEYRMEDAQKKLQDSYRTGPGGGGGTPAEKAIQAIQKIHELDNLPEIKKNNRVEEEMARETNRLAMSLAEAGCQVVECRRETYLEQTGLGQRAVVVLPCRCCNGTARFCERNVEDKNIRKEPIDWERPSTKRRYQNVIELEERQRQGEMISNREIEEERPTEWMEPKCPVVFHTVVAGNCYSFDIYNCGTQLTVGRTRAENNAIRSKYTKTLKKNVMIKLANELWQEAERSNNLKTDEGRRENLMDGWNGYVENFEWMKIKREWVVPNTESPTNRFIEGYLFSNLNKNTLKHEIQLRRSDPNGNRNINKLKHITNAIEACQKSSHMTDYVRLTGGETKWYVNSLKQGNTRRGESERQEDRRLQHRQNAIDNAEGYRADMPEIQQLELLRKIKEAVETRMEKKGDPAVVHIINKESWNNPALFSEELKEWEQNNGFDGSPTYRNLLMSIHRKNLGQFPMLALSGQAKDTITTIGTMGEELGPVITIFPGWIPEDIQWMLADENTLKTKNWQLTDTIVKNNLRGTVIDLSIIGIEIDSEIQASEKKLLTGMDAIAAKCLNTDLSILMKGSLKDIKHKKWELLLTDDIRASDAKVVYTMLETFIQLRSTLNLVIGGIELYKSDQLKDLTLQQIMEDLFEYSGKCEYKSAAWQMRDYIKGIPRDPKERTRTKEITKKSTRRVDEGLPNSRRVKEEFKKLRKEKEIATVRYLVEALAKNKRDTNKDSRRLVTVPEIKRMMVDLNMDDNINMDITKRIEFIESTNSFDPEELVTGAIELCEKCTTMGIKKRRLTDAEKEENDTYKKCRRLLESADKETQTKAQMILQVVEELDTKRIDINKKKDELAEMERSLEEAKDLADIHVQVTEISITTREEEEPVAMEEGNIKAQSEMRAVVEEEIIQWGRQRDVLEITLTDKELQKIKEQKRKDEVLQHHRENEERIRREREEERQRKEEERQQRIAAERERQRHAEASRQRESQEREARNRETNRGRQPLGATLEEMDQSGTISSDVNPDELGTDDSATTGAESAAENWNDMNPNSFASMTGGRGRARNFKNRTLKKRFQFQE